MVYGWTSILQQNVHRLCTTHADSNSACMRVNILVRDNSVIVRAQGIADSRRRCSNRGPRYGSVIEQCQTGDPGVIQATPRVITDESPRLYTQCIKCHRLSTVRGHAKHIVSVSSLDPRRRPDSNRPTRISDDLVLIVVDETVDTPKEPFAGLQHLACCVESTFALDYTEIPCDLICYSNLPTQE
jgi:hypothetical protein